MAGVYAGALLSFWLGEPVSRQDDHPSHAGHILQARQYALLLFA